MTERNPTRIQGCTQLPGFRFVSVVVTVLVGCSTQEALPPPEAYEPAMLKTDSTVSEPKSEFKEYMAPVSDGIAAGYRGAAHPALSQTDRLKVQAYWELPKDGKVVPFEYPLQMLDPLRPRYSTRKSSFPLEDYQPFSELRVAETAREYSASEFSVFMPADSELSTVGSMWAIDLEGVVRFLTQFHPAVSIHLDATGRVPGPNGGFGILRAVSSTHAEIWIRMHAEFEPQAPAGIELFFTPAHFSGELLVNRATGHVERFRLAIPGTRALNATLTVKLPTEALIDLIHVNRMELLGVQDSAPQSVEWSEELSSAETELQLKQAFFDVAEIDWVPPQSALSLAQEQNKTVFAVVLWGSLDDQSC